MSFPKTHSAHSPQRTMKRTSACRHSILEPLEPRRLLSASVVVTNLNDSGTGSLRQAILNAQSNGGDQTVTFQSGLSGTITLSSGLLEFSNAAADITIQGPEAGNLSVSGNQASSIFKIDSGVTATIIGLTLTDGNEGDGSGGAILNSGTLSVAHCTLSDDSASFAGGIQNDGTLNVLDSTFSGDTATGNGAYISPTGARAGESTTPSAEY